MIEMKVTAGYGVPLLPGCGIEIKGETLKINSGLTLDSRILAGEGLPKPKRTSWWVMLGYCIGISVLLIASRVWAQNPNDNIDDTQWLQQYIDNLRNPLTVERKPLQSGRYLVSDTIIVGSCMGLKIEGAGGHDRSANPGWRRPCTILEWTGGSKSMIELSGTSGLVLEGLNLRDPNGRATHGLRFSHGTGTLDIAIRDCGFYGPKIGIQWGTGFGESTCANVTYDSCYFQCEEAGVRIVNAQSLEHIFIRPDFAFCDRCIDVQGGGDVTVIGGGPYNCGSFLHLGKIGGNARGFDIQSIRPDGKNKRIALLTVEDTDQARGYGTITFSNVSQNDGQAGDTSKPLVTVPPGARVILRDCNFNGSMENWADVYSRGNVQGELSVQDCDGISSNDFKTLVEAKGSKAYYEFLRCGSIWGPRGSYSTFPDAAIIGPEPQFTPEEVAQIKRVLAGELITKGELKVELPDGP